MVRWIPTALVAGGFVPVLWLCLHALPAFSRWWLVEAPSWLERALIVFWPTYLLLLGGPGAHRSWLPAVSVVLNMLLYLVIAAIALAVRWLLRASAR